MVTTFLFRHRDRLIGAWGVGAMAACWPPKGWLPSLVPLLAGLGLRLWARHHIGAHSRGRILSSAVRCTGGPYRFLHHPLYVANFLVVLAIASLLAGPTANALAAASGPALLYAWLGNREQAALDAANPLERSSSLPANERRLASEWASLAPPLALWAALLWASPS